jgi:hypothetical protein
MCILIEIQFDYKSIMFELLMAKVFFFPYKVTSLRWWITIIKYCHLKHLDYISILWYAFFVLLKWNNIFFVQRYLLLKFAIF